MENHPCETFLSSQREEVFDVGEFKKCGCDSGIVRIPLFYPMIDPTTIEVSVITRERITFTTHKLEVDKDFLITHTTVSCTLIYLTLTTKMCVIVDVMNYLKSLSVM